MKIVAFLPVKGSSERIKNKNTTLMKVNLYFYIHWKNSYVVLLLMKFF